jgi:hypothetical protein
MATILVYFGLRRKWETYIAATDACVFNLDNDIMRIFYLRDGTVFVGYFVWFLEDEGRILLLCSVVSCMPLRWWWIFGGGGDAGLAG